MAISVKDKLVTVEGVKAAFDIEAEARNSADEALSTRINNIIAPEGDPSLTEVSDARVNKDGTTYSTLKARLDADTLATDAELTRIETDLSEQTGIRTLTSWSSGYYRLDGDPTGISTSDITSASNYICTYEQCSAGDIFLYSGKGTSAARRYAFLSDNSGQNNIISISGSTTALMNNYIIIAPAGANYIIINTDKRVDYKVKKIENSKYISQNDIDIMDTNYQGWKDDREYILDFCSHISGVPANGGVIGWFTTISQEESSSAYDNIIVSNNILIEDIHCNPALVPAGFLHTDHTPVSATISFMNVTI